MEWLTRTEDPFVRAEVRRRFRRGKRADIQAYHNYFKRVLTRALDGFWFDAIKAPINWEDCGFRTPTDDDVAFIRGEPGTYVIS